MARPKAAKAENAIRAEYRRRLQEHGYLRGIRKELDSSGLVCLEDFLTPAAVDKLQQQVLGLEGKAERSFESRNRKYSVKGAALRDSVVDELARSPYINDLINGILGVFPEECDAIITDRIGEDEIVPGLNIMRGPGDVTAFHFDGTFLNILVPVFIPKMEGPRRGQLTIYPNIRSFRKNLYDRLVVPVLCRLNLHRLIFTPLEVDYEVGNLYLFYGYRSYHGVLSPGAPGLRCTSSLTVGAKRF